MVIKGKGKKCQMWSSAHGYQGKVMLRKSSASTGRHAKKQQQKVRPCMSNFSSVSDQLAGWLELCIAGEMELKLAQ